MANAGPYLTSNRFALGGYGIDTSGTSKVAMTATLRRATSMVNTFCNGSLLHGGFDFRGGTITNEEHIFPIPNPLVAFPGSRRVFVRNKPLKTVSAFSILFTTAYQIDLNAATDIFVNTDLGFAEIVASQPTIIGYPPIGYWYGLYQPIAQISYTYGWTFEVADDICEAASPTLYYASQGQWSASVAPVVAIDGVTQDSGDYTVNYADGSINFATAPTPNTTVTVSYTTNLPDAIAQATGLVAVDLMGQSRIAARGMIGLQSIKVAEVALTQMSGSGDDYVTKNGIRLPAQAAAYLAPFALGSAA